MLNKIESCLEQRTRLTGYAIDLLAFKYEIAIRKYKVTTVSVLCPRATSRTVRKALLQHGFDVEIYTTPDTGGCRMSVLSVFVEVPYENYK